MPSLLHGPDAYADSLYTYLKSQQLPLNPGKLTLRIAILANGDVQFVKVLDSTIIDPATLVQAVMSLNNQWKPATQNKRAVCCYRKLYIEVADDKIKIFVPERL